MKVEVVILISFAFYFSTWNSNATLIASSKIRLCGREAKDEPRKLDGKLCSKKFVITLTVENGQVRDHYFFIEQSHLLSQILRMPLVQYMLV